MKAGQSAERERGNQILISPSSFETIDRDLEHVGRAYSIRGILIL